MERVVIGATDHDEIGARLAGDRCEYVRSVAPATRSVTEFHGRAAAESRCFRNGYGHGRHTRRSPLGRSTRATVSCRNHVDNDEVGVLGAQRTSRPFENRRVQKSQPSRRRFEARVISQLRLVRHECSIANIVRQQWSCHEVRTASVAGVSVRAGRGKDPGLQIGRIAHAGRLESLLSMFEPCTTSSSAIVAPARTAALSDRPVGSLDSDSERPSCSCLR